MPKPSPKEMLSQFGSVHKGKLQTSLLFKTTASKMLVKLTPAHQILLSELRLEVQH
jgi:hypothetical protein